MSDNELEVIVVTARYGKGSAKNILFNLSVLGEEELKNRLLINVEDAPRSAPGVDVYSSSGAIDANIRIRSVGSLTQVNKDDGSVNIDGVSMLAGNVSLGTLDVERMEILKGPQRTLFGRNSEAGAINITTRKLTQEFEVYGRGELGGDSQQLYESMVSGPLSEFLSSRLAIHYTSEDHWIENSTNGEPMTEPESLAFRRSLLWDVSAPIPRGFVSRGKAASGRLFEPAITLALW